MTDLIALVDTTNMRVGQVLIRKVDADYIKELPQKIATYDPEGRPDYLSGEKELTREQFYSAYKDKSVLEISIRGYHLQNETSAVFDMALFEYRQVFSYFYMCKHFLENVATQQYPFKMKDINAFAYFGAKKGSTKILY